MTNRLVIRIYCQNNTSQVHTNIKRAKQDDKLIQTQTTNATALSHQQYKIQYNKPHGVSLQMEGPFYKIGCHSVLKCPSLKLEIFLLFTLSSVGEERANLSAVVYL